jgi:micrococcal nuclease
MGCIITKYKTKKIENNLDNLKYEESKIFIPPIEYAKVCKVYDGDTFTILVKFPHNKEEVYRYSVRVRGIDCPELRTLDKDEKEIAILARDFVIEKFKEVNNIVKLNNISYDKYGRLCADVYIKDLLLKDMLLDEYLAVNYDGKSKVLPINWKLYHNNKVLHC